MPEIIDFPLVRDERGVVRWAERSGVAAVATEQELLDFCNRLRRIGGADLLPALAPGRTGDAESCLIARGLNFGCTVDGKGDDLWEMETYQSFTDEQVEAITALMGDDPYSGDYDCHCWTLPKHIGNAAEAFDRGLRFQHLAERDPE
jgi:hypothetical protein